MLDMCSNHGLRPAGAGQDFALHVFRDYNAAADELTWKARKGQCYYTNGEWDLPPRALYGQWDGGVDEQHAAYGWWLDEATYENIRPWRRRASEASLLPKGTTVTKAELEGATQLLHEAMLAVRLGSAKSTKRPRLQRHDS